MQAALARIHLHACYMLGEPSYQPVHACNAKDHNFAMLGHGVGWSWGGEPPDMHVAAWQPLLLDPIFNFYRCRHPVRSLAPWHVHIIIVHIYFFAYGIHIDIFFRSEDPLYYFVDHTYIFPSFFEKYIIFPSCLILFDERLRRTAPLLLLNRPAGRSCVNYTYFPFVNTLNCSFFGQLI